MLIFTAYLFNTPLYNYWVKQGRGEWWWRGDVWEIVDFVYTGVWEFFLFQPSLLDSRSLHWAFSWGVLRIALLFFRVFAFFTNHIPGAVIRVPFLECSVMAHHTKLLSVNVRGLNNPIKRNQITSHLAKSLADIVFLQEMHVKDPSNHPALHRKFPTYFLAPGSSKSREVEILLAGNLQFVVKDIIRDPRGHFVIVKGILETKIVTLASLYAPNSGQLEFLESVLGKIDSVKEGTLIVDLNSAMDLVWDKSNNSGRQQTATHAKTKVYDLITKLGLVNVWQSKNSSWRDYTYYSPKHMFFSRIDYFLVDTLSIDMVSSCVIGPVRWTDQAWLECRIDPSEKKGLHKRWSFDNTILLTDFWRQEIAKEIEEYFLKNDSDQVSLSMLWDAVKAMVRGKAISVASAMRK